MLPSFLSLIPPLLVLIVAFISRKMNLAFLVGIISATLISCSGATTEAFFLAIARFKETAYSLDNLYLYGFLILIGTLIITFTKTGSISALASFATARLHTKKQAETTSVLFSLSMFIDDYLSILTVGHVIQPIIERFGIPRVKLAYLIHSLAGVVVILMPISSWVATISAQLNQAGISLDKTTKPFIAADPFFIYLSTIPFLFYSFLTIGSVLFIVRSQLSFGPMYAYEKNSIVIPIQETLPLCPMKSTFPVIAPITILVLTMIVGILYSGNFWLFGGNQTIIGAVQHNNNPFFMMLIAAVMALLVAFGINLARKKLSINQIPSLFLNGFMLMKDALLMIFFSATLGTMLKNDIFTGNYLASTMLGSVALGLMPALFFVVSLTCALTTGSAWGTFSLMLSIVVPLLTSVTGGTLPLDPHEIALLYPCLGALFSGAVCGDHISPISETTIMAATSCGTSPLNHTKTQLPYVLPAVCWTLVGFIIAGYARSWGMSTALLFSLGISLLGCMVTLKIVNKGLNLK